ncbi:MAG TPA: hypothetical protein VJS42_04540 [Steroidobacteraceae bacterium]|nr:hypothetical protein [Steroidobacteraceae bacterium]
MIAIHDDMPHPVPPVAYLRYKENWFFLIMDKQNDIFGAVHVVSEPGFERIRFAAHLRVHGELFQHGSEVPFPDNFGFARQLGDGTLRLDFVKAHEQIDLHIKNEDMTLDLSFLKRSPVFNYSDYDHANPGKVTLGEVVNFATNQSFIHQQQGLYLRGTVAMKRGKALGKSFTVDAKGYRDHSRGVRCDNMTLRHFWTGLHFPNHVFGALSVCGVLRPTTPANAGYVYDDDGGLRPLRQVEFNGSGDGPEGLPAIVELSLTDIFGQPFTIVADLTKRFAHVPLHTEKAGATPFVYDIVENFVPLLLKETGETGIGLVEVGWSTPSRART